MGKIVICDGTTYDGNFVKGKYDGYGVFSSKAYKYIQNYLGIQETSRMDCPMARASLYGPMATSMRGVT